MDSHNLLVKELTEKNKSLTYNYKELYEKHEILSRDKEKDIGSNEKWINDLL